MNLLTSIVSRFIPAAFGGAAKAADSAARGYDGAQLGRHTDGWRTPSTSADAEIAAAGPRLRDRSRDLSRNTPYGKRAISIWVGNLVGDGIAPKPVSPDKATNETVSALFKEWCSTCDADGQLNFYGLQGLAVREMIEGGEVLVRRRWRRESDGLTIPMQLQILESDFLDSTRNGPLANGNSAVNGIEFDLRGKRTAYWLWSEHPGNTFISYGTRLLSSAVPASEIIHLYEKDRTQARGTPWCSPVIRKQRDLDDYQFAEGIRKKIESSMVGAVIGDDGDEGVNPAGPGDGKARVEDGNGNLVEKFAPGMFVYLRGGKDIKFNQPATVSGYSEYVKLELRAIAAGWRVPYELLTGDLSDVNFSSSRFSIQEFRRLVRQFQKQLIIPVMLEPMWAWFCEAAYVAGKINVPYVPVEWSPPDFEWINPLDDVRADKEAVRAGFRSPQEIITESGRDPEKVMAEIVAWNARLDGAGVILDTDPRRTTAAGQLQMAQDNQPPPA